MLDAKLLIMIGGLVCFVLAIVATYVGSKTWHVGHALLALGVFLFSIVFWYLAAAVLSKQQEQRAQINRLEKDLAEAQQQAVALMEGESAFEPNAVPRVDHLFETDDENEEATPPELGDGIRGRRTQLYRWIIDRGQVWVGAAPQSVEAETGATEVVLASEEPHGIQPNTLMFVFEAGVPVNENGEQVAQYLGEFQVVSVSEDQPDLIRIQPTRALTEAERQRIADSTASWTLYNVMPVDRPELLEHLTDDEIKGWFPEATQDEFLKDGEKAADDDPPERKVGYLADGTVAPPDDDQNVEEYRYSRRLRNYESAISTAAARREAATNRVAQLTHDRDRLRQAGELAEAKLADLGREETQLQNDKQMLAQELTVLKEYDDALSRRYNGVRDLAIHLHRENQQSAAALQRVGVTTTNP